MQVGRVYAAEQAMTTFHVTLPSQGDVEAFARSVMDAPFFAELAGQVCESPAVARKLLAHRQFVQVRAKRGPNRAYCRIMYNRGQSVNGVRVIDRWELAFGSRTSSRQVILHEIAHMLIPDRHQSHGREFCGAYLSLVYHFLGSSTGAALEECFRTKGVRYKDPLVWRVTVAQADWVPALQQVAAVRVLALTPQPESQQLTLF